MGSLKRVVVCIALCVVAGSAAWGAGSLEVTWRNAREYKAGCWTATARYPRFGGGSAVAKVANTELARAVKDAIGHFVGEARKEFGENGKLEHPYSMDLAATVSVARADLISVYFTSVWDTGGAHPSTEFHCYTFGLVAGKARQLHLKDLFSPGEDAVKAISAATIPKLRARGAGWVVNGEMKGVSPEQAEWFIVTPNTITMLFQPYEAGPYSDGSYIVKIPFAELPGLNRNGPLRGMRDEG